VRLRQARCREAGCGAGARPASMAKACSCSCSLFASSRSASCARTPYALRERFLHTLELALAACRCVAVPSHALPGCRDSSRQLCPRASRATLLTTRLLARRVACQQQHRPLRIAANSRCAPQHELLHYLHQLPCQAPQHNPVRTLCTLLAEDRQPGSVQRASPAPTGAQPRA